MEEVLLNKLRNKEPDIIPYIERFVAGEDVVEYVTDGIRFVLERVRPANQEQQAEANAEGKTSYVHINIYQGEDQIAECATDIPGIHNLIWSKVPKMAQRAWDIKCCIDGIPPYEQHQRISGIMFCIKNGYIPIAFTERISPKLSPAVVREVRKTFKGDTRLNFDQQFDFLKQLARLAEKSRNFAQGSILGPMEFSCRVRFKYVGKHITKSLYKAVKDQDYDAIKGALQQIHQTTDE